MKRTIPLLLTAAGGFALIVAFFIPATENWGGVYVSIAFDILAAIAMILGGGNLLKVHLKKVSDRPAGWGYSLITLTAFALTLGVGMSKFGTPPAAEQEKFGQTNVSLPLEQFPLTFSVPGTIPTKATGQPLPPSARWQTSPNDGRIVFRGWMTLDQKNDLLKFKQVLAWEDAVKELFEKAQPPDSLRGKAGYAVHHQVLTFNGAMTDADRDALLALSAAAPWRDAVESLHRETNRETSIEPSTVPAGFTALRAAHISPSLTFTPAEPPTLAIRGPMSSSVRDQLRRQYPTASPFDKAGRDRLLAQLREGGPINERQAAALDNAIAGVWTAAQLLKAVELAGGDARLSPEQAELLGSFVAAGPIDPWSIRETVEALKGAGPLSDAQAGAIATFLESAPTAGRFRFELYRGLSLAGPLTGEQKEFLLADYRNQHRWEAEVGRLFLAAHVEKYPWSGTYNAPGTPFWWIYEYAFKPLTATMFAMLAFYVASAAFRAFRAKNLEASLLLGTAFIILLGRTFAGTALTGWLPEPLSFLRTENLTITIMSVFNTAGSRAIMIGIALGVASASLKVLLGIDRSYLGSGEK